MPRLIFKLQARGDNPRTKAGARPALGSCVQKKHHGISLPTRT